jgi:hypothetical protein
VTPIYKDGKTIHLKAGKRMYVTVSGRRKLVVWHKGQPGEIVTWSQHCSGCSSDYDLGDRGAGCSECGYTGRSRGRCWVPLATEGHRQAVAKMKANDCEFKRWLAGQSNVRVADLGIQQQLFSLRGVRMVQLTVMRMDKPHAVVVPKRQYTRVARLIALQACCVWERLSVVARCVCVPLMSLQG